MNSEGKTVLALKEDADDLLFIAGGKDGKTIVDTNKDGKQNGSDGIVVKTEGLLNQLTQWKTGSDGYLLYSSTVAQSATAESDMLNVFHYAANNTTVEFSLKFYEKGGKSLISLGTNTSPDQSPGGSDYGDIKITKSYHNHPADTQYNKSYTERQSMGDIAKNRKGGDALKAIRNKITYPNYVFFPKSTNLYNVTQYGIELVKKINNNAKNLKK